MSEMNNIHRALAAIAVSTKSNRAEWVVGGSAGLMLRGLPLAAEPRDLDLYCDDEDVRAIYRSLKEYAVDAPVVSSTSMYRSTLCHFQIHGAQVELVGGFKVSSSVGTYETKVREQLIPYSYSVPLIGSPHAVKVVPLAHELWFNRLRGREDRVAVIAEAMAAAMPLHSCALRALEESNHFNAAARDDLHSLFRTREAGGIR